MIFAHALLLTMGLVTTAFAEDDVDTSSHPQLTQETLKPTADDCWFALSGGAMDGRRIDCGQLVVPEDWNQTDSGPIHLPFVRFRSRTNHEKGEPILFLTGGPGQRINLRTDDEVWENWIELLQSQPWSDRHDLIVATPRGSNWTDSNLDCPELRDPRIAAGAAGQADQRQDWRVTFWPAYSSCVERLTKTHDLDGYTNEQAVMDVLALVEMLGLERWSLMGVSYGTTLALEVMRRKPEGLQKVILDSVQPPDLDWIGDIFPNLDQSLTRMRKACADDIDCRRDYEDLDSLLAESVRALDNDGYYYPVQNNMLYGRVHFDVSSADLFNVLSQKLSDARALGTVPYMLANFVENDTTELGNAFPEMYDPQDGLAGSALDIRVCNMVADDLAAIDWDGLKSAFPHLQTYIDISRELYRCDGWTISEQPAREEEPVVSDIPTLLLAGYFDPLTPPEQAEHAARTLGKSHVFVFDQQSHSVLTSSPCAAVVTTAFLRNPEPRPDIDCSLHDPRIVFKSRDQAD